MLADKKTLFYPDAAATVELCGAMHLHTTFSDGDETAGELIAAALEVGLDFIVVTDHMTLEGVHQGLGGFHRNLFVEIGYEHQDTDNRNHYLAVGVGRTAEPSLSPQQYIDCVREQGGAGFIAHPMEKRHYFRRFPPYPWTAWDAKGYDGIEIWNQMSDWMENLKGWASAVRVLFPRRFMADPPAALLRTWDDLNAHSFVSGVGGVDAHTRQYRAGMVALTIFPTKVELKGIRTHVLLDKPLPRDNQAEASRRLCRALKDGCGFVSNFRRGDARGTRIHMTCADGSVRMPGRNPSAPQLPCRLAVRLPYPAQIVLLRNGERVGSTLGASAEFDIRTPGAYRIEARRKDKGWIYSNPFPVGEYPLL